MTVPCPVGCDPCPSWGYPCSPHTAWLVTTSLVKSMPSGSGICTPFLVLSAGRERHGEAKSHLPLPEPLFGSHGVYH